MKVRRNQRGPKGIYNGRRGKRPVLGPKRPLSPPVDIVVHGLAGRVEALVQQISRCSDFRDDEVARIRHEIVLRKYHVPGAAVAEALLKEIGETARIEKSSRG